MLTKGQIKFTPHKGPSAQQRGAVESPQVSKAPERVLIKASKASQVDRFLKNFEQTELIRKLATE